MDRGIKDRNILDKFTVNFCYIIEKYCKYIIVSGFLAIVSGRSRSTEDIDMIIERINYDLFKKIHLDLVKNGFVCMQSDNSKEIYDYLKDNLSVRYTYKNKILPEMEVKFSKDELDEYQLNNRVKIDLTGLDIWFSSVNINIAFKEEYLRSQKDIEDAKHLRLVYLDVIDEDKINEIKEKIRRLRL